MQKAEECRAAIGKTASSACAGDMFVPQPPNYFGFTYDSSISNESKTGNTTDIIVKPDGSRVLVVTMNVGGMKTTMIMEISKPTNMQNDYFSYFSDFAKVVKFSADVPI